jgi:c(7)-type cytochrome triheme protein
MRRSELFFIALVAVFSSAKVASAGAPEVKKPGFNHTQHQKAGLGMDSCDACHAGTSADGKLKFPGKDHKPCSNGACHADEYRKRGSQLCFTCHMRNEPWGDNPTKTSLVRPAGVPPEFSVGFSHKAHFERGGGKDSKAVGGCQNCHYRESGGEAPKVAPGLLAPAHVQCASCHEATAKPEMLKCGACHTFSSSIPAVAGERAAPEWRVTAKFRHETHRTDARTTPPGALDCQACHPGVSDAGPGQKPPSPKMAGCASTCHDGKVAFKATGFGCVRCHGSEPTP